MPGTAALDLRAARGTVSHDEVCARARALLPAWRARAAATERARSVPRETIDELFDAGLLQILTPRRHGGLELGWPTILEASRIAARACASTGWTICVVGGHVAIVARMPKPVQDMIFAAGPRQVISTAAAPADGTIAKEPGGYRVNGTWRFSSGVDHASWIVVNGRCDGHPSPPSPNLFFVPVRPDQVRIEDNWHVAGMRGTGSKDIRFDGLLVPEDRVTPFPDCFGPGSPGAALHPGDYVYDVPFAPYISTWVIAPILGCAEGAYEDCAAALRKRLGGGGKPAANRAPVAERLAESAAELACARLLYGSIVDTLHRAGLARRAVTDEEFVAIRRDRAYLARLCLNAIERLVRQMGTSGVADANPVQRHWRDLQVMATHRDFDWDVSMLAYGEHVLGDAAAP